MPSRKKSAEASAKPAAPGLGFVRAASSELMIGAAMLLLFILTAYYGWKKWGVPVTHRAEYKVSAASIAVTPPPPWIRSDIKAEAMRDGSLEGLSIFDTDLTLRVYRAFEMHPWVEKVACVGKRPQSRLVVEVEYRRPVAWVEVPAGVLPTNEVGLLPVDKKGVLLPTADFSATQANDYPRIAVSNLTPCGLPGSPWGDARVSICAEIASLLSEESQTLGLHRILAIESPEESSTNAPLYRLTTRKGLRIIWGSAPGREVAGEPTAAQKKVALRQIADMLAKSNADTNAREIDLRVAEGAPAQSRTAIRPAKPPQ